MPDQVGQDGIPVYQYRRPRRDPPGGRIHPPELEPGPSPGSREKGRKMAYISMLSGSYRYYIKPLPKKSAVSGPDLQAVPIHSGAAAGKLEPEPVPDPGSRAAVVLLEAGSRRRAE